MSIQEVLIEFESEHAAEQALNALNGKTLDNFHLYITYATNEQVKILQEMSVKEEQGIQQMEQGEKLDFMKIEKELIDDGLDKIINKEMIKEEQESESIDVEGLLDKYPELKAQIANPEVFKGLYDIFKKEYTKKMKQDSPPPQMKHTTLSPEQLKEKMKSSKIAKKSGKSPLDPPKRERKVSQESYSRSRSGSKSPGRSPKRKFNLEGIDREIVKKESKACSNTTSQQHMPQNVDSHVKKEEEIPRKRFVYSSQMAENKEMNKAFDKNSDYWRLGLAMGVYPDILPSSQKVNIQNLVEKNL